MGASTPSLEGRSRVHCTLEGRSNVTIVALDLHHALLVLPIIWVMFSSTKSNADLVSTNGFAGLVTLELGDN